VAGPQSSATASPSRAVPGSIAGLRPPAAPLTRPEPATSIAASTAVNDLELALYYHRAGDFENALQHYRALLQRNELNAQAHNNLWLLYQEKNLLQESARELQRAILIEPRNAGARNNYGVTLLMQGKSDEATAQFRSVLALDPQNLDALVNLALAQRAGGQVDVAKETLLSALTIAPRNAAAHYNLGQLYDQTNEPAHAVEHYRKFLETAGAEHATRAAAVRARIASLSRTPE
jgi:Tfp pilus assembly protein PilF